MTEPAVEFDLSGNELHLVYLPRDDTNWLKQQVQMPDPSTTPPRIYPSLRHASCEVVAGAVVLLQLVELGVRDEAQRRAVSGIDMHISECGLQRSAVEDHELHQLVQGLPVLGPNRVGR